MARFKVGDRVKAIKDDGNFSIYIGDTGVVNDDDVVPYVIWDKDNREIAVFEHMIELSDPASEIAQIVENSINSTEPIPVDKFEFTYKDEYGRTLSHKFEQSEGDYNLCDVIASFRLFILGIGWGREVVDKYIREAIS